MAGGQPRRLVEEEKLRVAARRHHRPMPAPELRQADQPTLHPPGATDAALAIVEDAPVAHHRPPLGDGGDLPERRDPVLPRHGPGSMAPPAASEYTWFLGPAPHIIGLVPGSPCERSGRRSARPVQPAGGRQTDTRG